uniref:30S ribosomal protein S8 n=1 Tax=Lotharella vacuolata TaxID=74820 RepID=A0A140JZU8_9EUKA|nr:30S ribosomal protein S8 [Lotharella vacuolata]BAU62625.1 30S ribosomal protein S8 [Lotharella vacuolata]
MTDNLGKMLNAIKNATLIKQDVLLIPYTLNNFLILKLLYDESFLESICILSKFDPFFHNKRFIKISLKYESKSKKSFINNIVRISKPSLRIYSPCNKIPKILNGLGLVIISTSQGIMTSREALVKGVGGELLFSIW